VLQIAGAGRPIAQVWEQLPDRTEFLNHLAEKAGCEPARGASQVPPSTTTSNPSGVGVDPPIEAIADDEAWLLPVLVNSIKSVGARLAAARL